MHALLMIVLGLASLAPRAATQLSPDEFLEPGAFVVDAALLAEAASWLPERPRHHAPWLSPEVDATLVLEEPSFVQVVFLREDTDRRHALGYFTYVEDGGQLTILDRQLVFPDLSRADKGTLLPGDAVTLRTALGDPRLFAAGTRIGFFVAAHGATAKPFKKWDASLATLPSSDPASNGLIGDGIFSTIDAFNPEAGSANLDLARHAALLDVGIWFQGGVSELLLGFETLDRRAPFADHDFNDVLLVVRVDAVDDTKLLTLAPGDPDGDGLFASDDAFPDDPERAEVLRVPSSGLNLLGLDHGYPAAGDGDVNDAVIGWSARMVRDADAAVKEIVLDVHLLARGTDAVQRLGLHLPGLPADATGEVRVERFTRPAESAGVLEPLMSVEDLIDVHERRIETLIPYTHQALEAIEGLPSVNTSAREVQRPAAASRLHILFDEAVPAELLGAPPWDPYWLIITGLGPADVHLPGVDAFADRPVGLPAETGPSAFLDDAGWPWLQELPTNGRFPLEGVPIETLYPRVYKWALSHGEKLPDWGRKPRTKRGSLPLSDYLVGRPWSLATHLP